MKGILIRNGLIGYKDLPKVACTSIKKTLYGLENREVYRYEDTGRDVHDYFWEKKVEIDKCDIKVIVIRDPVKRFLSAYSNRVGYHGECSRLYVEKNSPHLVEKIKSFDPALNDFVQDLDIYREIKSIGWHVKPMFDHDVRDLSFFTHVFKIENISFFSDLLSKVYDEKVQFGREQTGGVKLALKDLSEDSLDYLLNFYKDDYEFLSSIYSVDNVWKEWNNLNA